MARNDSKTHQLIMTAMIVMGLVAAAAIYRPDAPLLPSAQADAASIAAVCEDEDDFDDVEEIESDDEFGDEDEADEDEDFDEDFDEDDEFEGEEEWEDEEFREYEELYAVFELVHRFADIVESEERAAVMAVMFADELMEPEEAAEMLAEALEEVDSDVVKRAIRVRLVEFYAESDDLDSAKKTLRSLIVGD